MSSLNNFSKEETARRTRNIGYRHSAPHQFTNHNLRRFRNDAFPSRIGSECCGTESETEELSKEHKDLSESAKCEAKTIELVESIEKVAEGGCSIGLSMPSLEISSHDLHRSEEPLEQCSDDDGCTRHITQASLVELLEKVTEDYRSAKSFRLPLEISSDDHHNSEEQLEQVSDEVVLVETAQNIAEDAVNTNVALIETSTNTHITENTSNTSFIIVVPPCVENPNNILHNADARPAQYFEVSRSETSRKVSDDIRDYLTIPFPEYSNSSLCTSNTATRPQNEDNQILNLTTISTQILNDEDRCNVEEQSQQPSEKNPASKDPQSCFSDSTKATNGVFLLVLNEQFVKAHAGQTLRIEQVQVATQRPNCNDEPNVCQSDGQTSSSAGCSKSRENGGKGRISRSVEKKKELPSAATTIEISDSIPKKVPNALTQDSPPYCCNICDRTFSYLSVWKRHQHEGHLKPFLCPKCNKPFAEKQYLIEHQATHSEKKPYKCRFCDARFKHISGKLTHERYMHTNVACFECAVCGRIFSYKHTIIHHLRVHSGEKPFSCQTCGASFSAKSNLISHQGTHRKGKNLKCRICNQTFKYQKVMVRHERSHEEDPRFECALCGKRYQQKCELALHISSKHKDTIDVEGPGLECNLCCKKFRQKEGLAYHTSKQVCSKSAQERLHVEGPQFECALCGKKYHQKEDLTNHIFNHKDSKCAWARPQRKRMKQFHCQKCGKRYAVKSCLIKHQVAHSEERPYKCRFCDARFKHNSIKLMHEGYMHTKVAQFECAVCGKMFNYKRSIIRHMQVHSGQKPFRCQACGTSFSTKWSLVSHQRTHSKEKNFKCRICDQIFKHRHQQTAHERLHVEGARFECALCGKKYRQKRSLIYHILFKHKDGKVMPERLHEEVHPLECALCGKKFHQKVGLVYHTSKQVCNKSPNQRLNMEGPHFECALCGNKYRKKYGLAYHISKQVCNKSPNQHLNMEGPHLQCALCGKKYRTKYGLAYHISHNCC